MLVLLQHEMKRPGHEEESLKFGVAPTFWSWDLGVLLTNLKQLVYTHATANRPLLFDPGTLRSGI